jgi:hypothetical protein
MCTRLRIDLVTLGGDGNHWFTPSFIGEINKQYSYSKTHAPVTKLHAAKSATAPALCSAPEADSIPPDGLRILYAGRLAVRIANWDLPEIPPDPVYVDRCPTKEAVKSNLVPRQRQPPAKFRG